MNDDRYTLPDPPSPTAEPSSSHPEDRWNEDDLRRWLDSPRLAPWVGPWVESLRPSFGEALPRLLGRGLGEPKKIPGWMAGAAPDPTWLRQYLERSDVAAAWFEEGFLRDDPSWLADLLGAEQAKVARSFLLTGNVSDYAFDPVHGYRPAVRLLVDSLLRRKELVLTFRLSHGLKLHTDNPAAEERLPAAIRDELDAAGFQSNVPLSTQLCHLFDLLRRWLTGTPGNGGGEEGEAERSSHDFARGVAIVFENVHLLIPAERADVERNFLVDNLLHWSNSPELFRSHHCLILMADSLEDVGNELRARGGKIEQIPIPRPDRVADRTKFLLPLLDPGARMAETRVAQLSSGRSWIEHYGDGDYLERLHRLSRDTAGLTLLGIEDLLQQVSAAPEGGLRRRDVMELKRQRLRQESEGLLEVVDPRRALDSIGGYAALKERLAEVLEALHRADDPLVRATIPMGILFLGPPGTGKSIMAEALAGASGIGMAKLGDFRGMYVGQSERNLSRILSLIESLHPVIVFVDEFDQAFGRRGGPSGDGGVDRRIFGRLLEFMSDTAHRGKILWIGASNLPDQIDPAMKRAGRFDLVLPFLLPDAESREQIFRVILEHRLKRIGHVEERLTGDDYRELGRRTEGFSGAEIEAVIGEVLRRIAQVELREKPRATVTREHFERVLAVYQPSPGVRESYRRMEELAVREVSFLDLLPEDHRRRAAPDETSPEGGST